jgi:excinuclease ABC subunit B
MKSNHANIPFMQVMPKFKIQSTYNPTGDQPEAIKQIVSAFNAGHNKQTLLGITGSGKTFTMANVIEQIGKKTLIMAHNKTLAAQLYAEFKEFFPNNRVEFFVSYYDYYQPEAYVPSSDTYIEKDSAINEDIDRLRHSATQSLLDRDDVIVISSVSCIYGIGDPDEYRAQKINLTKGERKDREDFIRELVNIQYTRNDIDFSRGTFRVRGEMVEVFPASEDAKIIRIEFFDDEIEKISVADPLTAEVLARLEQISIYPSSHYVVGLEKQKNAVVTIKAELDEQLAKFLSEGKLVEHQRLKQKTEMDIEMIQETGFCSGIENYSRHFTGLAPGQPPPTLIDFYKKDFLLIVDESHMTIPQVGAMYRGDRSRKMNLVNYGFRLPSALDNRPLQFKEFEEKMDQVLFVSATPADYELEKSEGVIVEQVIRPTGLLDPVVIVRPATSQVDDLLKEIRIEIKKGNRILVTTLTKKSAESLSEYYEELGLKIKYLHSDIDTLERIEILNGLRAGDFDVLVGINLLREGLDLPEVGLVAILDADKEGFLRSERSLIQTIGRAARNLEGRVILYADRETGSMKKAMSETARRRMHQIEHNKKNKITPTALKKGVKSGVVDIIRGVKDKDLKKTRKKEVRALTKDQLEKRINELQGRMKKLAKELDFEQAAKIRKNQRLLKNK